MVGLILIGILLGNNYLSLEVHKTERQEKTRTTFYVRECFFAPANIYLAGYVNSEQGRMHSQPCNTLNLCMYVCMYKP